MGIGLELYQWAAKRGLEIPLLIFLLALTILLIIIAMNFKYEIRTTSPCRDCIYVKKTMKLTQLRAAYININRYLYENSNWNAQLINLNKILLIFQAFQKCLKFRICKGFTVILVLFSRKRSWSLIT